MKKHPTLKPLYSCPRCWREIEVKLPTPPQHGDVMVCTYCCAMLEFHTEAFIKLSIESFNELNQETRDALNEDVKRIVESHAKND